MGMNQPPPPPGGQYPPPGPPVDPPPGVDPNAGAYPPGQPGYPPQPDPNAGAYPPGQPGYPPQPDPNAGAYAPQGQPGYPPQPDPNAGAYAPPGQPGYPPQPGYPAPVKKSKTGLIIGLVLALIIVGGGVAVALVAMGSSSKTDPTVVGPSGTATPSKTGTGGQAKQPDRGDFIAFYEAPTSSSYKEMAISLEKDRVMEELAEALNQTFALPNDVKMGFAECGQPNAFYSAEKRLVVICYEMLEFASKLLPNDSEAVGGAVVFLFFHELGHAVIDQYQLPVTGREEDAADGVATWVMLEAEQPEIAISAARFFDALASQRAELNFADEHSLDQQRYYNIVCWIYGSNPSKYSSLVTKGVLPESRAARCANEYKQLKSTWDKLITPYVKN